jgi:uncharacterized membrane protein
MMPTERQRRPDAAVQGLVARVLFWGGLLSIALVMAGLVLYAARGGFHGHTLRLDRDPAATAPGNFSSVGQVLAGLRTRPVDPLAVSALGLVLLLMTPVLGVATAVPAFLASGDRRYAAIAAAVFTMLVASIVLAGGAG